MKIKKLPLNEIILGDCLKVMKTFPDKSLDLVLTDPPYGLGIDGQGLSISSNPKHNRKAHEFLGWDKGIPTKEYFDEMKRVSKHQIIFGGNYFIEHLSEGHKGWIVWDKGQHGLTMSDGELAYSSFDKPLRIMTYNRVEILKDGAVHPTMKPLELFREILSKYSEEGMTVLDPFGGSCTTAVACKQLKRNYICIEKEKRYVDICHQRLSQDMLF